MWIDIHLHLDDAAFDGDREAVLSRAAAAGIGLMISAGTSVEGGRRAIALAERSPGIRVAVGIHPEAAGTADTGALEALSELARHPLVVAIGETGLDYVREGAPRSIQMEAFRAQVRLGRELRLPVVVHNREAHADVERILREEGAVSVVFHCFSGSAEAAVRWADAGWMISLAGPLTFANAGSLKDVARQTPLDRLMVETDAPYLAPVPVRGRRCEPAHLVHTARVLAALRGIPPETLEGILEENARRVFFRHRERAGGREECVRGA